MSRVFIRSAYALPVSEYWTKSIADLMTDASNRVIDAVPGVKIDKVIVGNMMSGYANHQEHLGALLASSLGMKGVEAMKVEAACGSGGAAVHEGYLSIKSGEYENVLVVGVEKMKDMDTPKTTKALAMAESSDFTQAVGASFISLNALLMRLYMNSYNVDEELMDYFPVIAHKNAVTSPHAQYKKAITVEDVKRSQVIADPIRLLSSAPSGDGAAAVILSSKEGPVEVLASEIATNDLIVAQREEPLRFLATEIAFRKAMQKSGISASDIDFIELHDAFPIVASLGLEAMGISKRGKAPQDASNGRFNMGSELPILTFGGLKARGHPVGATGAYQVVEAFMQLAGTAGHNQVKGAKVGLTHNVGGVDTTSVIHIMRRVE
ncbi:MAG: thiolase C-terminal domain-containing protein [Nitrososphaeria archaeon]